MRRSLHRLRQAQTARTASAPLAQAAPAQLLPEAALEAVRRRNAALDLLFYDIGVLSDAEARDLSPWLAAEGALLIVPPSGAGAVRRCASIDEFMVAGGRSIRTLAVAGVGSSALGAAALARNVADALDEDVVAVVSGYGLADVAAEALGGFFWFGALNSVRHLFEPLDRARESGLIAEPLPDLTTGADDLLRRQSKDVQAVLSLLLEPGVALRCVVGHSKGNLVIAEALAALAEAQPQRLRALGAALAIVTLSAKIAMPVGCRHVIDVMGQFDAFGLLNSRPDIPTDEWVPNAWHHTNTELPGHLPVTQVLAGLRARGRLRAG
jgi:hypothetical protein